MDFIPLWYEYARTKTCQRGPARHIEVRLEISALRHPASAIDGPSYPETRVDDPQTGHRPRCADPRQRPPSADPEAEVNSSGEGPTRWTVGSGYVVRDVARSRPREPRMPEQSPSFLSFSRWQCSREPSMLN
ncbi:hypothetical protein LX32DRAFT_110061 [Colletotrichum zoysiae]|uniref:Uncharacterized protein n=1 Tax=Colletotrichum zoysiae TaxID=1216348 RepID=A0AAD9H8P3_9PEZI|nr:hypothetical protein LX32DRAFT_110061 [Colletotrichum zoysiae]